MAQNIYPTKNNLINTKKSLELAKTGYDLMDRKRSILVREVMQLMDEAKEIQTQISVTFKGAYAALMRAQIEMGDCNAAAECVPIDTSINITTRSVMGVEIPAVSIEKQELQLYYAFGQTAAALDDAYEKFSEVKLLTARLAQTESSVCRLADAIKRTAKRTNALGNIVIPEFDNTIKYITNVLEENEREDFTRLKVIKSVKIK